MGSIMIIKTRRPSDVRTSEITPKSVYLNRRRFIQSASALGLGAIAGVSPFSAAQAKLKGLVKGPYGTDEEPTSLSSITSYNNFYEFGADKGDPAKNARNFKTMPWSIAIEGEVGKPGNYNFEDLIAPHKLEERTYRLRCVEAWSMVVPWVGIPLADIIKRLEPTSRAKYVAFETLLDPKQMPGQRRSVLDWPYREGLRIDEAMNPLTLLAVGLYGEELPAQNGAPIRLVVPWKYGFKSIKSIVRIRFSETMPATSWNMSSPREYGFYSNVNPTVSHPRWSQARERRIGDFLKRKTLEFNGYAEEVAPMYAGMDLAKNF